MKKKVISYLVVFLLCGATAYMSWKILPVPARENSISPPSSVPIGGPFELVDPDGKKWTSQDFPGQYLVVYFGYTFCPDICPMALHNFTEALQILKKKGHTKILSLMQPLFITLDPERDRPQALRSFMGQFDPCIKGLTGSPEQIEATLKAYRVYRSKFIPDPQKPEYLLDHSSLFYVMTPEGAYKGSFNHQTPGEEIAQHLLAWITPSPPERS